MTTKVGHVAPGFGFLVIGLWHLFSNIRLYCIGPDSYVGSSWFPSPILHRHLELILIFLGSLTSISMDLFVRPAAHLPLDADGTIPTNHLHNFEHSSISLAFCVYAVFTIVFDRARLRLRYEMTVLLAAAAFAQELFMFHLHSTDRTGIEGHFHWLLQLVIVVSLASTLLSVHYRRSLAVSFVRSASIAFQGVWFIVMGYALWTPSFIAKGCYMNMEDGHYVVRCRSEEAIDRAKALVNLLFSWCITAMAVFSLSFYLYLNKIYSAEKALYKPLEMEAAVTTEEDEEDLEALKKMTAS